MQNIDMNTRRMMERIDLQESQITRQAEHATRDKRKIEALTRENNAYRALVGKLQLQAAGHRKDGR